MKQHDNESDKPKGRRLFDVRFYATRRVIRVRAESETDAFDTADSVVGSPLRWSASPADSRRRPIYEWKRGRGAVRIAPRKRGRK